jgi:hypothetical protein
LTLRIAFTIGFWRSSSVKTHGESFGCKDICRCLLIYASQLRKRLAV